jgi:uncharacterized protein
VKSEAAFPRTALWQRLDVDGLDACIVDRAGDDFRLSGTAVFLSDGAPAKLDYLVTCDGQWFTTSASISGWVDRQAISCEMVKSPESGWVINGQTVAGLDGLHDVDLGFTPATNMNALNRLGLEIGATVQTTAIWLDPGDWAVKPLVQTYHRMSTTIYSYASPVHDYSAHLEVDSFGLIQSYPGLWRLIVPASRSSSF